MFYRRELWVQKVMSQSSTSLCTCCTRANAFPEYDTCSQIHFLQNYVERLSDFFLIWGVYARFKKKMADSLQLIHSLFVHLVVGNVQRRIELLLS